MCSNPVIYMTVLTAHATMTDSYHGRLLSFYYFFLTFSLIIFSFLSVFIISSISILSFICDVHVCIFRMERDRFRGILERLHNFIACRLFPPKPQDLPPLAKCSWWIPCATKVMALLSECTAGLFLSLSSFIGRRTPSSMISSSLYAVWDL